MARIIITLEDGTEIESELDRDIMSIGRHPDNDVVIPSPSVSGRHATIKLRGDSYFVQDLDATNGTKLNGVDVEEARLEHGDRITFGSIPAVVQLVDRPAKRESAPKPVSYPAPDLKRTAPTSESSAPHPIARRPPQRSYNASNDYAQSSGCAGFLALLVFLVFAFVGGLCIRHYMDHGGFLIVDLVKKYTDKGDSEAAVKPKP